MLIEFSKEEICTMIKCCMCYEGEYNNTLKETALKEKLIKLFEKEFKKVDSSEMYFWE